MRRAAAVIVVLGLLAAGCDGWTEKETTTTVPSWALDPGAPAGNSSDGDGGGYDTVVAGDTWMGWYWRATAGGPIDVSYLDAEGCVGWASRAPVIEYNLPSDGGHWVFSFGPDVPVTGWGDEGEVPQGLVLIVRGPDGAWACNGDYQDWQYFPGPAVEFTSAQTGVYDVWLAVSSEAESVGGQIVIITPAASFPTTTTTVEGTEASTWPTTTTTTTPGLDDLSAFQAAPRPPEAVCPPGSTPDIPGDPAAPRPDLTADWVAAFDRESGLLVAAGGGSIWAFDPCRNRWEQMARGLDLASPDSMAYDAGHWNWATDVWAFDTRTAQWIELLPAG